MKKRSSRMARVHGLAENEEREYCRVMGEAQRQLDAHCQRLEELESYRRDYATRRPKGNVVSSAQWADYQSFLGRLDEAVHAQSRIVEEGRRNRDAHRQRWMAKRQKMESLQRVVDRYRDDEAQDEAREQQKTQDDLPVQPRPFPGR